MLNTKKLANHVRKNTFLAILSVMVVLWLFNLSLSFLGELGKLKENYTIVQAFLYVFWKSPKLLNEYLPMAALIGAVVGLGNLASHSEVTIMRAVGVSVYKIVFWVIQSVSILILVSWLINQFVLPYSSLKAKQIEKPDSTELSNEVSGYWTKYNDEATENIQGDVNSTNKTNTNSTSDKILYLDFINAKGNINQLTIWEVDKQAKIKSVTHAKSGQYLQQNNWQLQDVSTTKIKPDGTSHLTKLDTLNIQIPIQPKYVYMMTQYVQNLSITDLYVYNGFLEKNKKASRKYQMVFWEKVLSPFAFISLAMIACSFVFGSTRQQSMGSRIVIAILCGILFRYMQNLMHYMALASEAPVITFILLPIIISTGIALAMLKLKR